MNLILSFEDILQLIEKFAYTTYEVNFKAGPTGGDVDIILYMRQKPFRFVIANPLSADQTTQLTKTLEDFKQKETLDFC